VSNIEYQSCRKLWSNREIIFHLLTVAMLLRHIKTSAIPSLLQQKEQFYTATETSTSRVGMSMTSTKLFSGPHVVRHQIPQQLLCLPDLTKSEKDVGQRLSNLSTLRIRLAWTTIKHLTGRSRNSYRPCPITANSITSQLVKNGTYKHKDRE